MGNSTRPWASIPLGYDRCRVVAAGPNRREKSGQVSPLAMHRVWYRAALEAARNLCSTWGTQSVTGGGPFQVPGLRFRWGVIDAQSRLQVPMGGRSLGHVPHWQCTEADGGLLKAARNLRSTRQTQSMTGGGPRASILSGCD